MVKATTLSICLLAVASVVVAQVNAPVVHDRDDRVAPSRIFYWKSGGLEELHRWLKDNEGLLDRGDVCAVGYSWSDEKTKISTSNYSVADFLVTPDDEEVTRLIRDAESGLEVRVGVQYLPLKSGTSGIRIALAFEGATEAVFSEISRGEASAVREKGWKFLEAVKSIQTAGRLYRVYLNCSSPETSSLRPFMQHR
jgi:hypothetical protein